MKPELKFKSNALQINTQIIYCLAYIIAVAGELESDEEYMRSTVNQLHIEFCWWYKKNGIKFNGTRQIFSEEAIGGVMEEMFREVTLMLCHADA